MSCTESYKWNGGRRKQKRRVTIRAHEPPTTLLGNQYLAVYHHRPLYSTCEALDTINQPECLKKVQVRGLGGQHEHRRNAPQTPHALRLQHPLQTQTDASPMTRKRTSITCSLIAKANLRLWIYQCVCVVCELPLTDLLCNVVLLGHSQL